METKILHTDEPDDARTAVTAAVDLLRGGDIVALPTETVYGLAADAFNADAVAKIFDAKERPTFDPLIVHVVGYKGVEQVADVPANVEKILRRLANEFWPGPLTVILPKRPGVPDIVTAGLDTVAVRQSVSPIMKAVIQGLGSPLAAPSANRFGSISPTSSSAVESELGGRIPLIVDGGACNEGIESTIIKIEPNLQKPVLRILRAGPITKEQLQRFGKIEYGEQLSSEDGKPEAPGQLASHYAPKTPLRLLEKPADFVPEKGKKYALLSYRQKAKDGYLKLTDWDTVLALSSGSGKLPEAAVRLFFVMRQLDAAGVDEIICEPVAERGLGVAIMDRLRRAAKRSE
ncbi:MAG: L-threonylcarbamoyladenylate synthase [Verrucomicrobiales bacterium]